MKIKEADHNAKIKQAYANAVPDICHVILSDCENGKGQVILMTEEKKKKGFVKYLMMAASLLVALGAGALLMNVYHMNYAVASTISLEVNPGIQVTANEKERVLDVKALNADGETVIGDMDLSGSDIDVAVNALIGSMLRNGYLNELANSILISVDNDDPAKGEALQEKLTTEVEELLEAGGFIGAVLGQTLTGDSVLQQQADQYGITLGKAQLIRQILDSTTGHTFEELAPLSIHELNLIITTGSAEMEKVSSLGNASDKAYIGEAKAKETAFAHAGVSEQDLYYYKMDMNVEKGIMVYEIDFKCGGFEYEYDIDAETGEVVKNSRAVDENMPAGIGTAAAGGASPEADTQTSSDGAGTAQNTAQSGGTSAPSGTGTQTGGTTAPSGTGTQTGGTTSPSGTGTQAGGTTAPSGTGTQTGGTAAPSGTGTQAGGTTAPSGTGTQTGGAASGAVTAEQAKTIALNHAGQSASSVYFKKAQLDYENGKQVYEIEFVSGNTEYDYEIDAATGTVLKYDWDYEDDHNHGHGTGQAPASSGTITSEQAKTIALNHAGQSASSVYFEKVELDYDDGRQVYEVEFVSGNMEYDYEIDAASGTILKYDWDQD